jgi:hypothetical protein
LSYIDHYFVSVYFKTANADRQDIPILILPIRKILL